MFVLRCLRKAFGEKILVRIFRHDEAAKSDDKLKEFNHAGVYADPQWANIMQAKLQNMRTFPFKATWYIDTDIYANSESKLDVHQLVANTCSFELNSISDLRYLH